MGELKDVFFSKKQAFFAVVIVGVIAHGFMMLNKISYHDDISALFGLGSTTDLGRWGLEIIAWIGRVTGLGWYSTPLFMGSLSLVFIGMSAVLVCEILHIDSKKGMILSGGIMAAFPVVASTFAYMFTAAPYFFAYFLVILSVYLLARQFSVKSCAAAIFLISLSTGIYQASLAVCASLIVLRLIDRVLEDPDRTFADYIKEALLYAGTLFGSLVLYLIENQIALKLTDTEISDYQGMNGKYNIAMLPGKLLGTYHDFLGGGYTGINSTHFLSNSVKAVIVLTVIGLLVCLYQLECARILKLWALLLMTVFPIAVYLVNFFSTEESLYVHTLMIYSLVYVFIFPVCMMERVRLKTKQEKKDAGALGIQVWNCALSIFLVMFITVYVSLDNAAYLKMNFVQEQTIAYMNTLVTRIKNVDGYRDEYPVVLLGSKLSIADQSFYHSNRFDRITFDGFDNDLERLVNDGGWKSYLKYHVGYDPNYCGDYLDWWQLPEVEKMNCYPDDGSIKVVNESVVVKFTEYKTPDE